MDSEDQRSDCKEYNEMMDSVDQRSDFTEYNEIMDCVDQRSDSINNNSIDCNVQPDLDLHSFMSIVFFFFFCVCQWDPTQCHASK